MKVRYRIVERDYKLYVQRKRLFRWAYVYEDYNGKRVTICREQKYAIQNVVFQLLGTHEKADKPRVMTEYGVDSKGAYYLTGETRHYINTSYRYPMGDKDGAEK